MDIIVAKLIDFMKEVDAKSVFIQSAKGTEVFHLQKDNKLHRQGTGVIFYHSDSENNGFLKNDSILPGIQSFMIF